MFTAQNVQLSFSNTTLFAPFSLIIQKGEICLLQSESGTGKTSLLRWIAGISDKQMHAEGKIFLNGKDITELPAEQRRIGIFFSEALLFPHLTVAENIGIGVASFISGKERKELIKKSLINAGLPGIEKQDPLTLSTGQQARVALLRTVLSEPALLLLDEPFSNLDNDIRKTLIKYVLREIKRLNIPALIVSHDPRDRILSTNQPVTFLPFDEKKH